MSDSEQNHTLKGRIKLVRGAGKIRNHYTRRLLRIEEAACYLGVSIAKVRTLAWEGQLRYFQEKKGALMLFELAELDRWIDSHQVAC
jgi:excisionase family DNA binding protein